MTPDFTTLPHLELSWRSAFADNQGEIGGDISRRLSLQDWQKARSQAGEALANFQKSHYQGSYEFTKIIADDDDLQSWESLASELQDYEEILIFGTGGSSLGGRALQEIAATKSAEQSAKLRNLPAMNIIANIDPFYFDQLLRRQNWQKTAVIAISKSGETAETLMQLLTIYPLMRAALGNKRAASQIMVICQQGENSLGRLAEEWGFRRLPHPPLLGGRYSVLSIVGLLPAMIMNLNAYELRQGARDVLAQALQAKSLEDSLAAGSAAVIYGLEKFHQTKGAVMLAYSDKLGSIARWHRQLWAESLGKDGKGSTPVYGMGPVDQHSQLQLWLDGTPDKYFTVLGGALGGETLAIDPSLVHGHPELQTMAGSNLGELMTLSRQATMNTLIYHGCPLREINLYHVKEVNVGAIMMLMMIETVLIAHMTGVNPFDQPAVEHGKQLVRDYLAKLYHQRQPLKPVG